VQDHGQRTKAREKFREGDEIVLTGGPYVGTVGVFLRLRTNAEIGDPRAQWHDSKPPTGMARAASVCYLRFGRQDAIGKGALIWKNSPTVHCGQRQCRGKTAAARQFWPGLLFQRQRGSGALAE